MTTSLHSFHSSSNVTRFIMIIVCLFTLMLAIFAFSPKQNSSVSIPHAAVFSPPTTTTATSTKTATPASTSSISSPTPSTPTTSTPTTSENEVIDDNYDDDDDRYEKDSVYDENKEEIISKQNEKVCSSIEESEDTVIVVSCQFSHAQFVRLQYLGFRNFLANNLNNNKRRRRRRRRTNTNNTKARRRQQREDDDPDWFHFVVVDDSWDPVASKNIRDEAKRLGVHYLRVPPSWHSPEFVVARNWTRYMPTWDKRGGLMKGSASGRASISTQFAYDNLVLRRHNVSLAIENNNNNNALPVRRKGIYFYLDSDVLPFRDLDLERMFQVNPNPLLFSSDAEKKKTREEEEKETENQKQKEIVLIPQIPFPGVRYPWMALFAVNLSKVNERFSSSTSSPSSTSQQQVEQYEKMMKDLNWSIGLYTVPSTGEQIFLDAGGVSAEWLDKYKPTESVFQFIPEGVIRHWTNHIENPSLDSNNTTALVSSILHNNEALTRTFLVDLLISSGFPQITNDTGVRGRTCFYHYRAGSGYIVSQKLLHGRRIRILADLYLQIVLRGSSSSASTKAFEAEQRHFVQQDRKHFGLKRRIMIDMEINDGSYLKNSFFHHWNSRKNKDGEYDDADDEKWDIWGFEKRAELCQSVSKTQNYLFEFFANISARSKSSNKKSVKVVEEQKFRLFLFPNASLTFPSSQQSSSSSSSSSLPASGFSVSLVDYDGHEGSVGIDVRSVFRYITLEDDVMFRCSTEETEREVKRSLAELNLLQLVDSFIR